MSTSPRKQVGPSYLLVKDVLEADDDTLEAFQCTATLPGQVIRGAITAAVADMTVRFAAPLAAVRPALCIAAGGARAVADVVGNACDVGGVQGCINLVQYKKRRRPIAVDGEQQREGCDRLLATCDMHSKSSQAEDAAETESQVRMPDDACIQTSSSHSVSKHLPVQLAKPAKN